MRKISLNKGMGPQIVRHLRQFGPLPPKGILAGQAVDSAITDLWLGGGGVYNDVDIFRPAPPPSWQQRTAKANATAIRSTLAFSLEEPSEEVLRGAELGDEDRLYQGMNLVARTIETYGISHVTRKGMLNFVTCHMGSGKWGAPLTAELVISGFDLNCVRVAVDLATEELVWDLHYEQFLATRQLRIIVMHTPWHTFMRLSKKHRQLRETFVDYEAAAMACTAFADSPFLRTWRNTSSVSTLFGSKARQDAEDLSSILAPYFSLEGKTLYKRQNAYLTEWSETADFADTLEKVDLWQLRPRAQAPAEVQRRIDLMGNAAIQYSLPAAEAFLRKEGSKAAKKRTKLTQYFASRPESALLLSRACLDLFPEDYVRGASDDNLARRVDDYVTKHPRMVQFLAPLSLANQAACISRIAEGLDALALKYPLVHKGRWQGLLETRMTRVLELGVENLEKTLSDIQLAESKPFEIPQILWPEIPGVAIKELSSVAELMEEGAAMAHCVGGYGGALKESRGATRILSLKETCAPFNRSTVELYLSTSRVKSEFGTVSQLRVSIRQHFARKNTTPAPVLAEALKNLCAAYVRQENNAALTRAQQSLSNQEHQQALAA